MTTKANSTVSLKTSQGDVKAFIGKLLIIRILEVFDKIGDFCDHSNGGFIIINEQIVNDLKHLNFAKKYYKKAIPIIISETQRIETGDYFIDPKNPVISEPARQIDIDTIRNHGLKFYKILALPSNLSSRHLQAIVDNKMKDGDEVYVQCKRIGYQHMSADFVELDFNNHVTLHKVEKKLYTEEEMLNMMFRAYNLRTEDKEVRSTNSLKEWFRKNVK